MDLESIMKSHAEIMRTGLKHGEQIGWGKLCTEIDRLMDATGYSGLENQGFRKALMLVRGWVLSEMKDKP
jgi:hypothetical protein